MKAIFIYIEVGGGGVLSNDKFFAHKLSTTIFSGLNNKIEQNSTEKLEENLPQNSAMNTRTKKKQRRHSTAS